MYICLQGKKEISGKDFFTLLLKFHTFQFELTYFTEMSSLMTIQDQYRWYQTLYRIGNFLGRSTISLYKFQHLWVLSVLQVEYSCLILVMILVIQLMPTSRPEQMSTKYISTRGKGVVVTLTRRQQTVLSNTLTNISTLPTSSQ